MHKTKLDQIHHLAQMQTTNPVKKPQVIQGALSIKYMESPESSEAVNRGDL